MDLYRVLFAIWNGGATCFAFALLIISGMAMAPNRLDPIYPRNSYLPLVLVPIAITQLMLVVLFVVALIIRSSGLFYCLSVWLILLAVVTLGSVIACAAGLLEENERLTNESVFHTMHVYESNAEVGEFWGNFQRTEMCCGYFGPADWLYTVNSKTYPKACCSHTAISPEHSTRSKICVHRYANRPYLFKKGCMEPIKEEAGFEIRYTTFIIIGVVLFLYNIVGIILSYFIARRGYETKNNEYEDDYPDEYDYDY